MSEHPPQVEQVGIGDLIRLESIMYTVDQLEQGFRISKATQPSAIYENARRRRPLDRHMDLTVEEHVAGDLIRETYLIVRLKGKTQQWNMYIHCHITKEPEDV